MYGFGDNMKLTQKDKKLIEMASDLVKSNSDLYPPESPHVGAILLAKSGKVYKGINILTSHAICAEQVAIGQALACGEREFDTIVSVSLDSAGNTEVVSPCGVCRYLFDKLGKDLFIIVRDVENNINLKVKPGDLLPYRYERAEE